MRCAIYTRVSTKDKGQDVENQVRELEEYAKHRGWDIVLRYSDQKSGTTSDREQFQAMFDDARWRKFDVLLFWSLDRLSREGPLETLQHLQRLVACGVDFFSYREQFLDTMGFFKDAVIGILAALAKQESVRQSERVRAGVAKAKARGFDKRGRPYHHGRHQLFLPESKIITMAQHGWGSQRIADALGKSEMTIRRRMKELGVYRVYPTLPGKKKEVIE